MIVPYFWVRRSLFCWAHYFLGGPASSAHQPEELWCASDPSWDVSLSLHPSDQPVIWCNTVLYFLEYCVLSVMFVFCCVSTCPCAIISLDSRSLFSFRTLCLSSYSSSNCTSICFSYTHISKEPLGNMEVSNCVIWTHDRVFRSCLFTFLLQDSLMSSTSSSLLSSSLECVCLNLSVSISKRSLA